MDDNAKVPYDLDSESSDIGIRPIYWQEKN